MVVEHIKQIIKKLKTSTPINIFHPSNGLGRGLEAVRTIGNIKGSGRMNRLQSWESQPSRSHRKPGEEHKTECSHLPIYTLLFTFSTRHFIPATTPTTWCVFLHPTSLTCLCHLPQPSSSHHVNGRHRGKRACMLIPCSMHVISNWQRATKMRIF
jgi:hypothetical protein